MTQDKRHVAHDHFVYLVSTEDFENPPAWLADNFNIIDGGTHAGGSSRNKLIIFKDGTYLELFNWISEPKEFLAWSDKPPGLIDFALTSLDPTTAQSNYIAMSQALETSNGADLGVSFDHPRAGGRKRKDGTDVKWETTRIITNTAQDTPDASFFPTQRLDVPFFCHDVTERSVRVPFEDDSVTTHPCGVTGVHDIELVVPQSHFEHYLYLYEAILGTPRLQRHDKRTRSCASFNVPAPNPQGDASTVSVLAVQGSSEDYGGDPDQIWLFRRGIGIRSLVLTSSHEGGSHQELIALDTNSELPSSIFIRRKGT